MTKGIEVTSVRKGITTVNEAPEYYRRAGAHWCITTPAGVSASAVRPTCQDKWTVFAVGGEQSVEDRWMSDSEILMILKNIIKVAIEGDLSLMS